MQEWETVKKYVNLLDEAEKLETKRMMFFVFDDINWLINNMGMVFSEAGSAWDGAAALPECAGKPYALRAFGEALKGFLSAQEHFVKMGDLIENGLQKAMARFQNGDGGALEKPFPAIAVITEMKSMMKAMEAAFIPIDIGIGSMEEAEGMECRDGHYRDTVRGGLWDGGAGEQALLDVLWPMRTLEKVIIQADDAAMRAANKVDMLRPKAHSMVKTGSLVPGYFWEKEREERGQTQAGHIRPQPAVTRVVAGKKPVPGENAMTAEMLMPVWNMAASEKVSEKELFVGAKTGKQSCRERKTSLRKRLESAKEESRKMHDPANVRKQKSRVGEVQR